ncbi:MAG: hypothetical protein QXD59_01745 [Candidatus Caldarchaeum sp.]
MKKPWQVAQWEVARILKAALHPASGARPGWRSDASDGHYSFEIKFTAKRRFYLTAGMLRKIDRESVGRGHVPRLVIVFGTGTCVSLVPQWSLANAGNPTHIVTTDGQGIVLVEEEVVRWTTKGWVLVRIGKQLWSLSNVPTDAAMRRRIAAAHETPSGMKGDGGSKLSPPAPQKSC